MKKIVTLTLLAGTSLAFQLQALAEPYLPPLDKTYLIGDEATRAGWKIFDFYFDDPGAPDDVFYTKAVDNGFDFAKDKGHGGYFRGELADGGYYDRQLNQLPNSQSHNISEWTRATIRWICRSSASGH